LDYICRTWHIHDIGILERPFLLRAIRFNSIRITPGPLRASSSAKTNPAIDHQEIYRKVKYEVMCKEGLQCGRTHLLGGRSQNRQLPKGPLRYRKMSDAMGKKSLVITSGPLNDELPEVPARGVGLHLPQQFVLKKTELKRGSHYRFYLTIMYVSIC
jgi:hypothetical protein